MKIWLYSRWQLGDSPPGAMKEQAALAEFLAKAADPGTPFENLADICSAATPWFARATGRYISRSVRPGDAVIVASGDNLGWEVVKPLHGWLDDRRCLFFDLGQGWEDRGNGRVFRLLARLLAQRIERLGIDVTQPAWDGLHKGEPGALGQVVHDRVIEDDEDGRVVFG